MPAITGPHRWKMRLRPGVPETCPGEEKGPLPSLLSCGLDSPGSLHLHAGLPLFPDPMHLMRFSKKPAAVLGTERRAWPKPGDISQIFKNLHKLKEYSLFPSSSTRAASDKALNSLHPFWGPPPDPRLSRRLNSSCSLSATQ